MAWIRHPGRDLDAYLDGELEASAAHRVARAPRRLPSLPATGEDNGADPSITTCDGQQAAWLTAPSERKERVGGGSAEQIEPPVEELSGRTEGARPDQQFGMAHDRAERRVPESGVARAFAAPRRYVEVGIGVESVAG